MQCKVSIEASNNKEITQQEYKGPGKRKNRKQGKRLVKKGKAIGERKITAQGRKKDYLWYKH